MPSPKPDANASDETELMLSALREGIDDIDAQVVRLLGRRFQTTRRIGALKAKAGLPSLDATREADQDTRLVDLAMDVGVDPALVVKVFGEVRAQVRREHDAATEK